MDLRSGLLLMACSLLFAAEPLAKPEVPDPYGLGERLALIDYLKETWGVHPQADASYEQLVALYWQHARPVTVADEDKAHTQDRCQRLSNELEKRYGIHAPADADEDALRRLLADARAKSAQEAADAVASDIKNDTKDNRGPMKASDLGNLQARIDRAGSAVRQARERYAKCEQRKTELLARNAAAPQQQATLDGALAGALAERNRWKTASDQEMRSAHAVSSATRESYRLATDAYNAAVTAANNFMTEQTQMKAEYDALVQEQQRLQSQIANLDQERNELTTRLTNAQPIDQKDLGRAGGGTGLEVRLRAAVVLVAVQNGGSGTGFFVSRDGLLVTNAHVVGEGTAPMAALWDTGAHHVQTRLRLVTKLPDDDLALLRAEGEGDFTPLELSEMYDISRPVLAVGFPLAGGISRTLGTSPSDIVVTSGTLNAVRRQGETVEWIQHDCKMASGNSGGPLIDQASGTVIGINTLVIRPDQSGGAGDTLNFAIPAWKVRARFATVITPAR